jgi:hypothetical protein
MKLSMSRGVESCRKIAGIHDRLFTPGNMRQSQSMPELVGKYCREIHSSSSNRLFHSEIPNEGILITGRVQQDGSAFDLSQSDHTILKPSARVPAQVCRIRLSCRRRLLS